MLRLVSLLFMLLFLGVITLPVVAVLLAVSDEPVMTVAGDLDYRDLERAQTLLAQNDPRRMPAGSTQTLRLSEEDINVMLRYGLSRLGGGAAAVKLNPGGLSAYLAAELPHNPLGSWVNVHTEMLYSGNRLALEHLEIGRLQIPGVLADWLLQLAERQLHRDSLYRAVTDSVSKLQFAQGNVAITYQWQPELVDQVRSRGTQVLISAADGERLLAYTERIASIAAQPGLNAGASMDSFMVPLFELAAARSRQGEPGAENRALLAALAIYINGLNLARLVNIPEGERYQPRKLVLTLRGRPDLAQHFSISAAMAAAGGSPLADAVGLSKEVNDSTRGSGFSFTDLAADRAGVRFAEVATGDAAGRLQQLLATGAGESDYMPAINGLAEFMQADALQRRYGGVGSPAYQAVVTDIDNRVAALPVHKL